MPRAALTMRSVIFMRIVLVGVAAKIYFRAAPCAAFSMSAATAFGCDTYTAWLPLTSMTVEPARLDMLRWASGGIILSSVVSKYQLGFVFHAGSLILPLSASTPQGTCESA